VGGLVFGIGMTLASGCGNKTLVRVGGGNLKAVVVFIYMAYSANVTLRGIFAVPRTEWLQTPATTLNLSTHQTLPHLLHESLGMSLGNAELVHGPAGGRCPDGLCLLQQGVLGEQGQPAVAGIVLGAVVVAGWYVTGKMGWTENPETLTEMAVGTNSKLAESMSFIAPAGYTLELWSLWTDKGTLVTWGIATVFGVGVGSFLYAIATKAFRWEHFVSAQDMFRHIIGGVLMGFGGVTAMGCTVGQGITGFSTLVDRRHHYLRRDRGWFGHRHHEIRILADDARSLIVSTDLGRCPVHCPQPNPAIEIFRSANCRSAIMDDSASVRWVERRRQCTGRRGFARRRNGWRAVSQTRRLLSGLQPVRVQFPVDSTTLEATMQFRKSLMAAADGGDAASAACRHGTDRAANARHGRLEQGHGRLDDRHDQSADDEFSMMGMMDPKVMEPWMKAMTDPKMMASMMQHDGSQGHHSLDQQHDRSQDDEQHDGDGRSQGVDALDPDHDRSQVHECDDRHGRPEDVDALHHRDDRSEDDEFDDLGGRSQGMDSLHHLDDRSRSS
jgi:uncharacterized membrane protein YedE/YeeE